MNLHPKLSTGALILFGLTGGLLGSNAYTNTDFSGHVKYQFQASHYDNDSLFHKAFGDTSQQQQLATRLKLKWQQEGWAFNSDYQIIGQYGDLLNSDIQLPFTDTTAIEQIDQRRLFNLSRELSSGEKQSTFHRFDRLNVSYTNQNTVVRLGRQAISWGNGLAYNPLDFLNPFDPATVDTEYKPGDDMLYGQYLINNGNDIQTIWVARKDPFTDQHDSDVDSHAIKYHGFIGANEFDLLAANHYDETVFGIGTTINVSEAIWRTDLSLANEFSWVTNLSYSWLGFGKNMSGFIEYFFNGYGVKESEYENIGEHSELLEKLLRRELFTPGRRYAALSVTTEVTPLLHISNNLLINLGDHSGLYQLIARYNLADNWQLTGNVNFNIGGKGTEFGGFPVQGSEEYLSQRSGVFTQLAWYF